MRMKLVFPALTASAILAACAGDHGPKEIGGALIGTSVVIDGKAQSAHGTACREPDGTWRIES